MKKKSIDTIGNRTRDLPACSTVPQPTAPQRVVTGRCQRPVTTRPTTLHGIMQNQRLLVQF